MVGSSDPFLVGETRVAIKGNPNFGDIRVLMVGVRNNNSNNVCGEVWFNELRLTDFDQRDGWGATGMVNMRLADLGSLNLTGLHKSIGLGSVDSKVADRSRDAVTQYDIATNMDLGKFIPQKLVFDSGVEVGIVVDFDDIGLAVDLLEVYAVKASAYKVCCF